MATRHISIVAYQRRYNLKIFVISLAVLLSLCGVSWASENTCYGCNDYDAISDVERCLTQLKFPNRNISPDSAMPSFESQLMIDYRCIHRLQHFVYYCMDKANNCMNQVIDN